MHRKTSSSGSPFEKDFSFSRACRIGGTIAVAGTAPLGDDGKTACMGDAYGQAKRRIDMLFRDPAWVANTCLAEIYPDR